jgi:Fe2+ or Zn2+ uptake regulation protein
MSYQRAINQLKIDGFRLTEARVAIIKLFFESGHPLSVADLGKRLESIQIRLNKTTVYREVYFLISKSIILEVGVSQGQMYYEYNHQDHHHHLICTNCKSIQDIPLNDDIKTQEKQIQKLKNFKVTSHSLDFYGLCSGCR